MEKEPIYTRRVNAGTRVYYLDAHKDRKGSMYLCISEIPTERNPMQKRRRIFLYPENIGEFAKAFGEITALMEEQTSTNAKA